MGEHIMQSMLPLLGSMEEARERAARDAALVHPIPWTERMAGMFERERAGPPLPVPCTTIWSPLVTTASWRGSQETACCSKTKQMHPVLLCSKNFQRAALLQPSPLVPQPSLALP